MWITTWLDWGVEIHYIEKEKGCRMEAQKKSCLSCEICHEVPMGRQVVWQSSLQIMP